jgi:hypothetical protein
MYKIAGLLLLSLVTLLLLPHLLYWLLWLFPGRGLPPKTAGQLEDAGRIRRAERIWPLQAVCATAIAVAIYIATMILCRRLDLTSS